VHRLVRLDGVLGHFCQRAVCGPLADVSTRGVAEYHRRARILAGLLVTGRRGVRYALGATCVVGFQPPGLRRPRPRSKPSHSRASLAARNRHTGSSCARAAGTADPHIDAGRACRDRLACSKDWLPCATARSASALGNPRGGHRFRATHPAVQGVAPKGRPCPGQNSVVADRASPSGLEAEGGGPATRDLAHRPRPARRTPRCPRPCTGKDLGTGCPTRPRYMSAAACRSRLVEAVMESPHQRRDDATRRVTRSYHAPSIVSRGRGAIYIRATSEDR
jgi:hypothetical protein